MKKRRWQWVGILLVVGVMGCGKDEKPQTPFGSVKAVREYRERLDSVIVEANAIELGVRDRAVGSTGQATGQNLSPVYQELRPRLTALIDELDGIKVPKRLRDMHADLGAALALRLEAFDLVIAGWEIEREQTFDEARSNYVSAALKLNEANEFLLQVSEVLLELDIALGEVEGRNPVS